MTAAILPAAGCKTPGTPRDVSFTVDLRQSEPGRVEVEMRLQGRPGSSARISSFIQPEAIRVESLRARQGGSALEVEESRDETGFGRWVVAPPPDSGPVTVSYSVRPGAPEETRMSGPTGYRFGYLDRRFGLFGGRQIFLLPVEPGRPDAIRVQFLLPDRQEIVAPWKEGNGPRDFQTRGAEAASELLQAVLGVGRFDRAISPDGKFRLHILESLPEVSRKESARQVLDLRAYLDDRLDCSGWPYDLLLVPKAPDGMLVSVPPGRSGMGLSPGEGLPTRWLSIGRALGQACLAGRQDLLGGMEEGRWVLEGLPVFLAVGYSDRSGWRSRQAWLEQFYYESAALEIDLRKGGRAGEGLRREWRAALVLDHVSRELRRRGLPAVEETCRKTLGAGKPIDYPRFIPREVQLRLKRWLEPSPHPFPFPGRGEDEPARRLPAPPSLPAGPGGSGRIDLYLGARNFGLLEQCGCKSRQMGGMGRRATLLSRRLRGGAPAVALELGDALPFDPFSSILDRQKESESDLALSLMAKSGITAVVAGYAELAFGPSFLARRVARLPAGLKILSANLRVPGLSLPPALGVENDSSPVRIFGAVDLASYHLGRALEFEDATASVPVEEPARALGRSLQGADPGGLVAVAGPLGPSAVLEIHRTVPRISLVLTSDFFHFQQDPRLIFDRPFGAGYSTFGMLGETLVVILKSDAYALVRLRLAFNSGGRIEGASLEDLPLDEEIPDRADVRARLDAHYAALAREAGLSEAGPVGTPLRERLHAAYVGGTVCADCHREESAQWRSTPHASAFATLLARRRQGVPGCFACHVTGYRQPSGYRTMADHSLRHVQCESCHGPGSRHVEAPARANILRVPSFRDCAECHDEKHSEMREENFPRYWSRILHHPAPPAGP